MASIKRILTTTVLIILWFILVMVIVLMATYEGKTGNSYHFHLEKAITLSFSVSLTPFLFRWGIIRFRSSRKNRNKAADRENENQTKDMTDS